MKQRKHVVFTLAIVVMAILALSVNTALAGSTTRTTPLPDTHAPVCYRVESFAPGVQQLECFDTGKDIVKVEVKSDSRYELEWNESNVILKVYPDHKGAFTTWFVQDKMGSINTGTFGR